MRGEPRPSGVRPSRSGEHPAGTSEQPSRSGERPAGSGESGLLARPSASQERARQTGNLPIPSPLDGHAPVDSIEEMDWSEILEEGAAEDSAPEIQRPDGDEAFFIEMESDRRGVEPGNEAAAWGVSGTPISAPIVQHQSAPTRDPFVMPASHFVDLPDEVFADEVFADEPSIPDTWAEAPEPEDLSDGSIDIMVDQDFQSWEQPVVKTDPFAQAHAADDGWGAAANVFDDGDAAALARSSAADAPALPFESPGVEPDDELRIAVDSIEVPIPTIDIDEEDTPRTTQELVSAPTPPTGFDAKPGPPPVAQQTPTSLPPLPGEPEDGPVYGAGSDDPLTAGEAPDWFEPDLRAWSGCCARTRDVG